MNDGEIKFYGSYQELIKSGISVSMSINKIENERPMLNRFNSLINEVESSKLLGERKSDRQISENSNNKSIQDEKKDDSIHVLNLVSSQYLELSKSSLFMNLEAKVPTEIKINQNDENLDNEINKFGLINWKTYFIYFKLGGGIASIFNFLLFMLAQFAVVASDYWVSNW